MTSNQSLVEKVRARLNLSSQKDLNKDIAKVFTANDNLLQVSSWIPMKDFFKKATGGDGFPCGHITQIVGKPDSGKSTAMAEGMVATQRLGGVAYLIDAEHKFSLERFATMGGIPDDLVVIQVESLEEAWDAIDRILNEIRVLRSEGITEPMFLGWDSVAASVPNAILSDDSGDAHVAVEAKINNKNVRKLRQAIKETEIACVFINHYYMTQPKTKYERSEMIIKGGEELTFLSTLILVTKQGAQITRTIHEEEQKIGRVTRFLVHKGHFHGRTMNQDVFVVDKGILNSEAELTEYRKSLRGEL